MFRMLLQEAFRWIVALTTLAGSGALIGTVPLFQEAAPAIELELADVEPPAEEVLPEIVIEPADLGMSGLAFHPAIMYRGDDECKDVYVVRGSLKNHGPGLLSDIKITYTVPSSVTVTLSPTSENSLDTNKPLRITMVVSITDTEAWQAGNPSMIMIPLTATATVEAEEMVTATAMAIIYNACTEVEPEIPEEPKEPEEPDNGMGIAGLAFHPGHLNSGGVCRTTYTAQGSLKNHGPAQAVSAVISVTHISAPPGVTVTVSVEPSEVVSLTTSKPHRFTVRVEVDGETWSAAGKGETIEVTIEATVNGESGPAATATMTVRNQCKGEGSKIKGNDPGAKGKPETPGKPDKTEKDKPDKPEKPSHPLEGGPPGQNKDKKNK